jgi:2-methylcitrate dehydratase PrpD
MDLENLSAKVAHHIVATTFADLPDHVVEVTKQSLLDAIGVTFAASTLGEACGAFAEIAREAETPRGATVIGYGFRTSAAMAAFVNGSMAHSLDYEDTFDPALVHPNAAVVPAALALAETLPNIDGRKLITAIALGCDLACRMGLAIDGHDKKGLSVRYMSGVFGATAAAGKLLELTEEQLKHAFASTIFQAAFSSEGFLYGESHMRAVREAFAAKAGVIGAQLAKRGVKAFDQPFEAKYGLFSIYTGGQCNLEPLLTDLGRKFQGANVSFKPWPSCRGTHAFIEAALWLSEKHQIRPEKIRSAHAVVSPFFMNLCEPAPRKQKPQTAIDAKFSIPFTLATALQTGKVGLDAFRPEAMSDGEILKMAARVDHEIEPSWPTEEATRGILRLTTLDGTTLSKQIDAPLGHPDNPMTTAALQQKFVECAAYAQAPIRTDRVTEIGSTIAKLETISNVSGLLA